MNRSVAAVTVVAALTVLHHVDGAAYAEQSGCTVSATSVNFGNYDPFSFTPKDSTGEIRYDCFNGFDFDVRVEISRGSSPAWDTRRMYNSGQPLEYNLYLDSTRQTVWGTGSGGSQPLIDNNIRGSDGAVTVTVYGRIPARQNVGAGTYTDNVVATLKW